MRGTARIRDNPTDAGLVFLDVLLHALLVSGGITGGLWFVIERHSVLRVLLLLIGIGLMAVGSLPAVLYSQLERSQYVREAGYHGGWEVDEENKRDATSVSGQSLVGAISTRAQTFLWLIPPLSLIGPPERCVSITMKLIVTGAILAVPVYILI